MLDRLSHVRAAIEVETACPAAKPDAERLRILGWNATAMAMAAIANVEAVKALRVRQRAETAIGQPTARQPYQSRQSNQRHVVSG